MLPAEKVILPQNDPLKPYYNPSLARYKGKLLISIRSSTWTLGKNGGGQKIIGGKLHTDVILGEVDEETLTAKNLKKLTYSGNIHEYIANIGLEDARLFARDDKLYAIGVCMSKEDRRGETVHIAKGEIKGNKLIFEELLTKPWPTRTEKNWTIPEVPSRYFDYIYSPTHVLKDGKLLGEHEYHGLLHGGSQAIKWEDGWLSFQHKVFRSNAVVSGTVRQYVSYAIKYNAEGFATEISQGFILFGTNAVEFISGLVLSQGKLLVSLGIGDAHCALALIDPADLRFKPFDYKDEAIRIYFNKDSSSSWNEEPIRAYLPERQAPTTNPI
jgi:predicted GH43/DUF377 family glycosyl hydrolase